MLRGTALFLILRNHHALHRTVCIDASKACDVAEQDSPTLHVELTFFSLLLRGFFVVPFLLICVSSCLLVPVLLLLLFFLIRPASTVFARINLLRCYTSGNVSQHALQQIVPNKGMACIHDKFVFEESCYINSILCFWFLSSQDVLFNYAVNG